MKRAVLAVVAVALLAPGAAVAHPLGNFTVNRHAEITVSGARLYVHYALDLAEIPAFQEGAAIRRPTAARRLASKLVLVVDGRRRSLRVLASRASPHPGAGGLETLRFDAVYDGGAAARALRFEDRNFPNRLGWKEVVVRAERGARVASASAPATSRSDELRHYPNDLLQRPPDTTSATAVIEPGTLPGDPPGLGSGPPAPTLRGGFEGLVERGDAGAGVVLLSLALALFWGAAHALTPGHGKAIVAAYLVGSRGTARHALALGGIVTVTHTVGVYALGIVTLALSEFVVPEQLYPWLNLASALLVVGVGVAVLRRRLPLGRDRAHHHHHDHDDHHGGNRGLLAIGISGGLLPCPTALVVLLAAISIHRVAFGLLLIVAFSLGLAAVVSAVGLLAVTARSTFGRLNLESSLVRALPAVSACAIVGLGLVMTFRSLPTVV